MGKIMKKVLIFTALAVLSIFLASCQGKLVQLTATPDFGDGDNNKNDGDAVLTDSDSPLTDDDSPLTDNDSPLTDDDSPLTDDDDSPVTDEDEVPDEIGVECEPEGEKKCNGAKTSILECIDGAWETNETCENNETCDDTREAILCAPHICVPATTYCKLGNVYTCANDGLSEEMTEDCTATQYCDDSSTPNFPAICVDQVCTPNELYCDANALKECNAQGSASSTVKECGTGVCDETLENCVFTGEVGGTENFDRTGQRGNFFDCTKSVKVIEFAQELEYAGSKNLSWAIYEAEGNSTTYNRIFIKTATVTGTGRSYYSTGNISVNLVSGKKYIFITSWDGSIKLYFLNNSSGTVINVDFALVSKGHSVSSSSLPESLINPEKYNPVFNQKIKFIE